MQTYHTVTPLPAGFTGRPVTRVSHVSETRPAGVEGDLPATVKVAVIVKATALRLNSRGVRALRRKKVELIPV